MDVETGSKFDGFERKENGREFDDVLKAQAEPSHPLSFDSWAARPAPLQQRRQSHRDAIDFDALKIFMILAGLTAGMALGLRLLF